MSKPVTVVSALQDGDVRDTAQIGDDAILGVAAKYLVVEHRQQRRALSAGGHVAAAKVRHHRDAGHFGQGIGIADLPREGRRQIRAVAQRLTVAADRGHTLRVDPGIAQQRECGFGKTLGQFHIELTELVEGNAVGRIEHARDAALEGGIERRWR